MNLEVEMKKDRSVIVMVVVVEGVEKEGIDMDSDESFNVEVARREVLKRCIPMDEIGVLYDCAFDVIFLYDERWLVGGILEHPRNLRKREEEMLVGAVDEMKEEATGDTNRTVRERGEIGERRDSGNDTDGTMDERDKSDRNDKSSWEKVEGVGIYVKRLSKTYDDIGSYVGELARSYELWYKYCRRVKYVSVWCTPDGVMVLGGVVPPEAVDWSDFTEAKRPKSFHPVGG